MLDMGFKPAVDRIVAQTPEASARRSSSRRRSRAPPARSPPPTRATRAATPRRPARADKADIEHRFLAVDSQSAKLDRLVEHLRGEEGGRTLVFVRTKRGADRLVKRLRNHQVEAAAMHGDKSQGQRERALARFERGDVDALIATDVAARGIDVDGITQVVNFDAPGDQRLLRAPGRPHRPRRRARHRDQLRPRRPGRRGAADGRRPRPRPGVRPGTRTPAAARVAAAPAARQRPSGPLAPPSPPQGKGRPDDRRRPHRRRSGPATAAASRSASSTARRCRCRQPGPQPPTATSASPAGGSGPARQRSRRRRPTAATTPGSKCAGPGLLEFEVRRAPDRADNAIAKACHTSASAVARARDVVGQR